MNDEGLNGDEKAEDGIYAGTFNTAGIKEGWHLFRIVATAKGKENYSTPNYFRIFPANLSEKIKADSAFAEAITDKYFSGDIEKGMTLDEQAAYRLGVAEEIRNIPGVVSADVSEDGGMVLSFRHLKYYAIFPNLHENGDTNENEVTKHNEPKIKADITRETEKSLKEYGKRYDNLMRNSSLGNNKKPFISSDDALLLSPFLHQFGKNDSYYNGFLQLNESRYYTFPAKEYLNEQADLEAFKNLQNYGIIILDTHGMVKDGDHLFATGHKVNEADNIKYKKDLETGRIGIAKVAIFDPFDWKPQYYLVTSQFFKEYSTTLPNSLVYLSACNSLIDKGKNKQDELESILKYIMKAGAIIGYERTVFPSYTAQIGKSLFQNLLEYDTVKEAVNKAKKDVDPLTDALNFAKIIIKGNEELKIIDVVTKNGGFEDGFDNWETNNAGINGGIFPILPYKGNNYATLRSPGAYISQTFKLPDNAAYILANVAGFARNTDPDTDSWRTCYGTLKVFLTDEAGNRIEKGSLGTPQSSKPVSGLLGWSSNGFQVADFAGQTVTITFEFTNNKGDDRTCVSQVYTDNILVRNSY